MAEKEEVSEPGSAPSLSRYQFGISDYLPTAGSFLPTVGLEPGEKQNLLCFVPEGFVSEGFVPSPAQPLEALVSLLSPTASDDCTPEALPHEE